MMSRIVVGVDASDHAKRALAWALGEARLREAELELVHAVHQPDIAAMPAVLPMPSHEELVAVGETLLDELLAEVDVTGVKVSRTVRSGGAAGVLCQAARDADLAVVGARGLGGFRGLLLGSVTQQVVAHASCPVVVVVPEDR
jgi:nucleotide-binding universal stress UspA family protein